MTIEKAALVAAALWLGMATHPSRAAQPDQDPEESSVQRKAQAQADLTKADAVFAEFSKLRILSSQPRVLTKQLKRKTELFKKTESAYQNVIRHHDAELTLAAVYQIGMAYLDFRDTLLAIPAPATLTAEQVEIYRATLAEQAAPFEKKARRTFQMVVEKAAELSIQSEHVELAKRKLADLTPAKQPAP